MIRWLMRGCDREAKRADPWSLSTPLLQWSKQDAWTIGDAVQGTLITGATGSGKTSGSARALAHAMLRQGFGGLVLTTKPDERAMWEEYCARTKRSSDLRIFGPESEPWRYNFLAHELTREGTGGGHTENVLNLLTIALDAIEHGSGNGGGREDANYWRQATRALVRNCIDLLGMSAGTVSIPDLHRVVLSAPTSPEQMRSKEWQEGSFCFTCLGKADKRAKSPREAHDFELVADFFMVQWPTLAEKTRSVIASTCASMIDALNRGRLRELLCGETTITPNDTEDGAVIVIDLPVKEYGELGVIAQTIWKLAFQRSIERRDLGRSMRPVFLWVDEFQLLAASPDAAFQSTCRSSRVATVYLTQNISSVHGALGGNEKAKAEATSLFANLTTKIWHAQADATTNEWASTQIGRHLELLSTGSTSHSTEDLWTGLTGLGGEGRNGSSTAGYSEHYEFEVQPREFTRLRTGGPSNRYEVDAVVFQSGRVFASTGRTWLPVTFQQRA